MPLRVEAEVEAAVEQPEGSKEVSREEQEAVVALEDVHRLVVALEGADQREEASQEASRTRNAGTALTGWADQCIIIDHILANRTRNACTPMMEGVDRGTRK